MKLRHFVIGSPVLRHEDNYMKFIIVMASSPCFRNRNDIKAPLYE
jgi:hypothetical protein